MDLCTEPMGTSLLCFEVQSLESYAQIANSGQIKRFESKNFDFNPPRTFLNRLCELSAG